LVPKLHFIIFTTRVKEEFDFNKA